MDTKIYHRTDSKVDLIAKDFSLLFVVRKLCGRANIDLYATLRVTGHDSVSSFLAAFGTQLYGHPDAIVLAAKHFERTPVYQAAADAAIETLGAARIAKELAARCEEASHFTQAHAMQFRIDMKTRADEPLANTVSRDEAAFAEFAKERRASRETEARKAHVGNGIGSSIWTERIGGDEHE
ncbi:hypothetical protein [Paraburkholderia fungorum]|uniref:Uncharacterized protein n=1 Tax=Paraburkholderia fungorum TaxID=134537 RepID=A0AAW3UZQ0_9BURK|nr:hypothetical protein [Paraburkholderia fungorum]MBB4515843.1 hypothetical protein [Paraburkholderia fungorum]MBB6203741.1 hypothetical protein [Paraburkholderia fungorum]